MPTQQHSLNFVPRRKNKIELWKSLGAGGSALQFGSYTWCYKHHSTVHCSELPSTLSSKEQLSHPWGSSVKCAMIWYNSALYVETFFYSEQLVLCCIFQALNEVATWERYHHQPFMATISGCNVLFPLKPTPSANHNPFLTATSLLSWKENKNVYRGEGTLRLLHSQLD